MAFIPIWNSWYFRFAIVEGVERCHNDCKWSPLHLAAVFGAA
jgi:hypothetical protein